MKKIKEYNIYLKKNDKVLVFFENQIYTFEYENIYQISEEINLKKEDKINLILSLDFFEIDNTFSSKKISKTILYKKIYISLKKKIFNEIKNIFKNNKIRVYSFLEILTFNNLNMNIENKLIFLEKEKGFEINFEKEKIIHIEEIDISEENYSKEIDFSGYQVIFDLSEKISLISNIKEYSNLEEIKNNMFDKNYLIFITYILILIFTYITIFYLKNTDKIETEISELNLKIEEKNNQISEMEEKLKKVNQEEDNIDFNRKKIDFYKDIENFIELTKYGIEYEAINYENGIWEIIGNVIDKENLYSFDKKINELYKKIDIKKIVNKENRIQFIYNFRRKKDEDQ